MKICVYSALLMFLVSCAVGCGNGKQGSVTITSDWAVSDLEFGYLLVSATQPAERTAYIHESTTPLVRVLCTAKDGSYIIQGGSSTYVLCSDSVYVDGQDVRCGLYAYIGIRKVEVASMIRTVHAFAQVKDKQADRYIQKKYAEVEQQEFEVEKRRLAEEAEAAEIRLSQEKARIAHERELMEIKAKQAKDAAEREAKLEEERRKSARERRKRDQITYAAAAARAFNGLKFDYKEYVVIDREIERVAQSIAVDEPLWEKLHSAVESKDYLLALGLMGGGSRLSEYPNPGEVERIIGDFFNRTFRLRLKFKNKKTSESFSKMARSFGYWCDYRDMRVSPSSFSGTAVGDGLEHVYEFAIDARINYLILDKSYTNDGWMGYRQKTYEIISDTRIDSAEKASLLSRATESFLKSIHACAKKQMSEYQMERVTGGFYKRFGER